MNFDIEFAMQNFLQALAGIPMTLLITLIAVGIGMPLALLIAVIRMKKIKVLSPLATLYLSFMRGTPIIVQIFIVYNGLPLIIQAVGGAFGKEVDLNGINPLIYAFIVYILSASAGFAEMWKAALSSVQRDQEEAGLMVGLTKWQTYRYIIIPQAAATAAPSMCSISLNLLKNTSLVFLMTVLDISARAKITAGLQYKYLEGYVDIFVTYLIVCTVLEFLFKLWEKRVNAYRTRKERGV